MPTFKQKNVIRSYKLRLQEKLKTVTEETENATTFLNHCIEEVISLALIKSIKKFIHLRFWLYVSSLVSLLKTWTRQQ